eukprot:UN02420
MNTNPFAQECKKRWTSKQVKGGRNRRIGNLSWPDNSWTSMDFSWTSMHLCRKRCSGKDIFQMLESPDIQVSMINKMVCYTVFYLRYTCI